MMAAGATPAAMNWADPAWFPADLDVRGGRIGMLHIDPDVLERLGRALDDVHDAPTAVHLKKEGIFPLVHGVRSLALARQLTETGTVARIAALVADGALDATMGAELTDSLSFFMGLKLKAGLAEIDTGVGNGTTPNGMYAATIRDLDGNGTADYVYAGDLLGNLWKFDLRSSSSSAQQPPACCCRGRTCARCCCASGSSIRPRASVCARHW